jgi:hypothetical protein
MMFIKIDGFKLRAVGNGSARTQTPHDATRLAGVTCFGCCDGFRSE